MSRGVMAHLNQYLLITAMVFACCTIMLVHLFVFPLYDTKLTTHQAKTVGEIEQSLCMTNTRRLAKAKRHKCPPEGIVTVAQGGRLGNQIWEYASVWGVARVTGLVPYVPR
jgi:galactoside 2-L-fucosyltransferase 1/2